MQQATSTVTDTVEKGGNFFSKLVNSTQNLLNKTENFATTTAQKTLNVTQTIKDVPGKVVEKTTGFVDKGINIANQVKDTAQSTVQTGVNFGTSVTSSVTQGTQGATSNPLGAITDIGSNLVNNTVQLGQNLGQQATEL
jgi:hypothetical protein